MAKNPVQVIPMEVVQGDQINIQMINNQARNKNLVTYFGLLILFLIMCFLVFPGFILPKILDRETLILYFFISYCSLTLAVPTIYFSRKPERLERVREYFT